MLVIGFIVRTINIQVQPNAMNVDEASSGYEAYSIVNLGIDRNGNSFPVFLLSWGSGQNALYTYMIIPFVKLFGLSIITTRLPMAILGCVSLIIMYKILLMLKDKKLALIGLAFFVICPWHIAKSRWGLESNVFPDLVLIAIYMLIKSLKDNKKLLYYLSFAVLGLCSYAYGTSYFFLPLFVIPLLIYLLVKKKIKINDGIIALAIVFLISLPIIIFVIINKFNLPEIKLFCFTIPKMTINRFEMVSSLFSKNFIGESIKNFITSIKILIIQNDGQGWNGIPIYGLTYVFSLPLMIIGIIKSFKSNDEKKYANIFNIWFIAAFLLLFVCEPNINRINIIIIPLIYYTVLGLNEIINKNKIIDITIFSVYLIAFIMFLITYAKIDFNKYYVFEGDVEDTISYIDSINADKVYFEYKIKEPYIYTLFYTKTDPNVFVNTVEYFKEGGSFDNIKSFDKYYYYLPEEITPEN